MLLAGCATVPEGREPARGLSLAPAAQGIDVIGTNREIGFGRAEAGAVAAAARVLGEAPAPATVAAGCGLSAVAWRRAGLTMYFDAGAFVGWRDGAGRSAGAVCPG